MRRGGARGTGKLRAAPAQGCDRRLRLLLASSSLAALLIGAGAPAAYAACTNITGAYANNVNISGICVKNTSFTGNITNAGTISSSGISFTNGTISGSIIDSGTLAGGIVIDDTSKVTSTKTAISITGPTFTGGITNSGTISGGFYGIDVNGFTGGVSTFAGGISNSGTISAGDDGIYVDNVSTFSGGVSNGGTITASDIGIAIGEEPSFVSTFLGGVANSGAIIANRTGILIGAGVTSFSGGISNSGMISGGFYGIDVNGLTGGVSTFAGGISNSGVISESLYGIYVDNVSTFAGGVSNSGMIMASFGIALGAELGFVSTFLGGIANSGTIIANRTGILLGPGVTSFSGGISNSGTISGGAYGIDVDGFISGGVSTFAGGISNSGVISESLYGIYVDNVSAFSGGISNSGTISAGVGIALGATTTLVSTFLGGIANSGTIMASKTGILVGSGVRSFSGGITNTGTISGIKGIVVAGLIPVSVFDSGTIVGTGGVAVDLSDNAAGNTFTLGPGYSITGDVLGHSGGGDTFQLGGSGSASFDVALIDVHYLGFEYYVKTGTSTWTLTGSTTAVTPWTINQGTLAVSADANLGAASGSLTFGGGTLQFLAGFTSDRSITLNAGGGTIDTDGNDATLGGVIGGAGGLTVENSGTIAGALTLTGANTYTGGTALSSGEIIIGNNSALGSGTLSMAAGTTLSFLSTGNFTIANPITLSGDPTVAPPAGTTQTLAGIIADGATPGTLDMNGAGTLVLTATNTYTGGTTISAGTLALTGTGSIAASSGVLDNGTFDISALTNGGTSITSLAGSGAVALGANTLTLTNASGTFSGAIGGSGGLTLTAGTETLTGTDTYTGATVINGGILDVEGTITGSSNVTVNAGGTLTGTGTVDPPTVTIASGASFAPGSAGVPGTSMTIAGNLAFQSGALYVVYLNPTATTSANVTGTASLAGTVQANFATGAYTSNRPYDILQSAGLGGTSFATLATVDLPAGFAASLSYTTTDVLLNLTSQLGAGTSLNENQENVATGLNTYFNNGGTLPASFVNLYGLTGSRLANALTQLSGEAAADAVFGDFQLMDEFLNLMLDPFVYGRSGGGIGGSGPALGFAPEEADNLPPEVALAYAEIFKAPPASFAQRWTAWGASFGGSGTTAGDPTVGSHNVTTSTFGFAGGMDYHFSPDTVAGFAVGGGGTNWGLAEGLGDGRSDALQLGVYGITHNGPAYLAGALAFTNNWFVTNRSALGDLLTANFAGQGYGGRVEGGYRFAVLPTLGVAPYAAVQAQSFQTPGYSESDVGGGGFGLSYAAMSASDVRSELGARLDAPTLLDGMPLILRGRLAWAHDWISNPALDAAFESLPGSSFVVNGAPLPPNSALTSAGAELYLTAHLSLLVKFDGEFAPGSQIYAGSGTLRYTW